MQASYAMTSDQERKATEPITNMSSQSKRDAIKCHLVDPVITINCKIVACRVVWRGTNTDTNWKNIVAYRDRCDSVLERVFGVDMYVSAITGMSNRPPKKSNLARMVYPAVGYWVVSERDKLETVVATLQGMLQQEADVRYMSSLGQTTPEEVASCLCATMKDHSGGFVRRKIQESHDWLQRGDIPFEMPARLVTMPFASDTVKQVARNALAGMTDAKICMQYVQK